MNLSLSDIFTDLFSSNTRTLHVKTYSADGFVHVPEAVQESMLFTDPTKRIVWTHRVSMTTWRTAIGKTVWSYRVQKVSFSQNQITYKLSTVLHCGVRLHNILNRFLPCSLPRNSVTDSRNTKQLNWTALIFPGGTGNIFMPLPFSQPLLPSPVTVTWGREDASYVRQLSHGKWVSEWVNEGVQDVGSCWQVTRGEQDSNWGWVCWAASSYPCWQHNSI